MCCSGLACSLVGPSTYIVRSIRYVRFEEAPCRMDPGPMTYIKERVMPSAQSGLS